MISPPPTRWNGTLALKHFLLRRRQLRSDRKKTLGCCCCLFRHRHRSTHGRAKNSRRKKTFAKKNYSTETCHEKETRLSLFSFSLPFPSTQGTVRNFSTVVSKNWGRGGNTERVRGGQKNWHSQISFSSSIKKIWCGRFCAGGGEKICVSLVQEKRGPKDDRFQKNQQTT